MMTESGLLRIPPDQSSGSGHSGTPRHPSIIKPILSKRVCFYKSGDPQFSGLRMVINNRTFKTFDTLLDSLSKKVPLPFGVRNITTPRGVHAVNTLDELEDGKSYICSDSRKVKPINLAMARKKLPPWYHARPASSRRRTVQQARFFPGQNNHKKERVAVRTPKRLLVFRNGVPSVRHIAVLHKRTTTTYESILEYISELIQFHVVKLHTPDGRRVDGLPGLILCSGIVVAAGREPFWPANYNAEKSAATTMQRSNRLGVRRLKAFHYKKKSLSPTFNSRKFSPSSERYIVNRIHDSIAESSCDLPSNPTNSMELESGRVLESEGDPCLGDGAEGQDCSLPTEDDIEKSFRVNQDGSMTVEMKVRLTLKEEETIHWTTTLSRSSAANQLDETCLPEPEAAQDIGSIKNSLDLQSPASSIDTLKKDKTGDNDEDPPSMGNGAFSESSNEEEMVKVQAAVVTQMRPPTPGHKQIRKKQASVESVKTVTPEGIQEDMIGSYSYREQTEHGAMTEQYCMVKQKSTKPVPKPRRFESLDASSINDTNVSMFKSAEILQIESSGEEVTETVLHIYEQQTCRDNFLANLCAQGMSASGVSFCRPASSGTGQLSCSNDFETESWRPSTASESVGIWRAESLLVTSDLTLPSFHTGAIQAINPQQPLTKHNEGKDEPQQREVVKDKRASSKAVNKRVRLLMSPGKRQKEHSAQPTEKRKKAKTFSSAGFIRKIYRNKSKSPKSMMKPKKAPTQNRDGGVTAKSSQEFDDTVQPVLPSESKEMQQNGALNKASQSRGVLTRQTSVHPEKKKENGAYDVSESMLLPAFHSSSSVTNEYVENWLEKVHTNPPAHLNEESEKLEAVTVVQTENGKCGESDVRKGSVIVRLQETSDVQTCQTLKLPENMQAASIKQRIKSFENQSASPSMERKNQQIAHSQTTSMNTRTCNGSTQSNTEEIKPHSNHQSVGIIPPEVSTETPAANENESHPIKNSLQNASSFDMLSMDLPPPPPPEVNVELSNIDCCMTEVASAASSPLYRFSSVSSHMSDNHTFSISPTSDKAVSPTDHMTDVTALIQTVIPSKLAEALLPRPPSIKRAPLISNLSLDRKMSLRKAHLDKYTLCREASSETPASSTPTDIEGDNVLPNSISSNGIPVPTDENSISDLKKSPSCFSPANSTSLTSEERMPSATISSSEAPTPSDLPFKETKMNQTPPLTQMESPKPSVKNMSSPSPERRPQLPHNSPKLSSIHNQHPDKTRKHATPTPSPSTERKKTLHKAKLQKRSSPYSQSLDMASPVRQSRKLLSRNLSSDNVSEPTTKTQRKTPSERKRQTPQAIKSAELDKSCTQADQSDENKADKTESSMAEPEIMPPPLNIGNQPDMKPVLEEICYSIKSIRQITQNKRPSCLEKSNSLPDFSSHVASTFGSSTKALLAFLSVMTLKDGITNLNMDELNANNVSCAEALKMIDSLREIASIEDSHELKASLTNLQRSASRQLLQSWKGFQEFSDKCRSSTPSGSERELVTSPEGDCDIEENVIDEIMDNLAIPEKLKEELASLSADGKSDDKENMSARIIEEVEPNSHAKRFTEDAQEVKANVDVSAIVKKFTDIHQPKQVRTCSITETTKHEPTDVATTDKDDKYGKNGGAESPPAELKDEEENEERQIDSAVLTVKENEEDTQSCGDASNEEDQGEENLQQDQVEDKSNQEKANMNKVMSSNKHSEQDTSEEEDMEGDQLQIHNEEVISEEEPGSGPEELNVSSANKDLEQKVIHQRSASRSDAGEHHSSEEEVEREGTLQESRESDELTNPESHPEEEEEEEDKQPSSNYYTELSFGLSVSVEESNWSSEEEQPEVESRELKVIIEEEPGSTEEEEHLDYLPDQTKYKNLKTLTEEAEEDSSDDEEKVQSPVERDRSNLNEYQDSNSRNDSRSLTKSDSFGADEDSGNDHSSCEEHVEVERPMTEHISSSTEEELSYFEKESISEEEHANVDTYTEKSRIEYQEALLTTQPDVKKCEKAVEEVPSEEIKSQSIAERVILLEKQVAEAQKRKESTARSPIRRFSRRKAPLESDGEDSDMPSSRSAPQSSLSFSYDSSGVVTTESEGNKVRSIRDMFLAKSATDIQQGQRRFPSSNKSELSEVRAETSASAGYQSQTSSELSSGEDDSPRKSITKGFVRRTIERLYGKKDVNPDEKASERPPPASKQKKKEYPSIFSPFHTARSKAVSELSYFNSTNALDTLGEATQCVAFNAQVGPEDSVPIDNRRWLLGENTLIRKSVSDPVGLNKAFTDPPQDEACEDTEGNDPYSLFSTKSEQEDKKEAFPRKCTYFSLPHGSESDACQDDLSTVSKSSANEDSVVDTKDNPEDTKMWAERNGTLPSFGVTDFKMKDNKVHPLTEPPADAEVVVAQPVRGQAVVNRRLQEPDMLDVLYTFCGQNCPIL